jgi:hypothetical protein
MLMFSAVNILSSLLLNAVNPALLYNNHEGCHFRESGIAVEKTGFRASS